MTTLVTGAAGFIGSHLVRALYADGADVVSVVRDRNHPALRPPLVFGDISDADFCRRVIADYKIETIYHLASSSIVSVCSEDPVGAMTTNVIGTARLLQAVRDSGRQIRVVVMTSDKAYGHAEAPYREDTPLDPRHAYEASKSCQDITARMFRYNFGVDVTVVRAVNTYGPGDPNTSRIIPNTIRRALRGEPPIVHSGASSMRRQYVYVGDLVSALRTVALAGKEDIYNVGGPDAPMTVEQVITRVLCRLGRTDLDIVEVDRDTRFQEIQSQSVDDQRLRQLGWVPIVDFDEGVDRTIEVARAEVKEK